MPSAESIQRLERAQKDLNAVEASPNFTTIRNTSALLFKWERAKSVAMLWCDRTETHPIARWSNESLKRFLSTLKVLLASAKVVIAGSMEASTTNSAEWRISSECHCRP